MYLGRMGGSLALRITFYICEADETYEQKKVKKSKALEIAGEADRVKCCVQTDRIKDLIPALFFIYIKIYSNV